MPSPRQHQGTLAEDQAEQFLLAKGYRILGRHLTSRYGEIDILAQDEDIIVAVEVKARQSTTFGTAAEAVSNDKLEKLAETFHHILEKNHWTDRPIRIDLITLEPDGINHLMGVGPD